MSIFNTGKSLIKGRKVVPVFLTINNDYAAYAACTIASLIQHSKPKNRYRVIVLHDGLSFKNYFRLRSLVTSNCEIQFKKMTHSLSLRTISMYCSKMTGSGDFFSSAVYYYRLFIARLFPMYTKAIYVDSDVIFMDDVAKLYDIDVEDYAIGATVDPKVEEIPEFRGYVENALGIPCKEYVNSGVLLLNLKRLRKIHFMTQMIDLIEKYKADLVAPDQDYLNFICRGQIKHLNPNWNAAPVKGEQPRTSRIVHYNLFTKPWHSKGVAGEEIFWETAKHTKFYNELLQKRDAYSVKETRIKQAQVEALIKKAGKLSKVNEPILKNL